MLPRVSRILFGILIVFCSLSYWQIGHAQVREKVFPETGHKIVGEFLDYYLSHPHPEIVYGLPITDMYQDAKIDGNYIQYFERARFELHQDALPGQRVIISHLGRYMYEPGAVLKMPLNFPACKKFPEIGFQVCYTFLDFFNEQGGLEQFGYPISNFELHDGLIVQYFQKARFEWRPQMPPGQRVGLTDLGRQYFYVRDEPEGILPGNGFDNTLDLHARAFTQSAVSPLKGQQLVFITVKNQTDQPVAEAKITVTVQLPDGVQKVLPLELITNQVGVASVPFVYDSKIHGMVQILVEVTYEGLKTHTRTSFQLW